MEPEQESVVEGPSSRNSQRNVLPNQDQNIQVAPDPELVLERDMEDIEPMRAHVEDLVTRFN
ncbi:hypothetical protein AMTR_s00107p00031650 [Amborella trichopoda]|uniref:Uncharacterized protein n=1 Tax=Amborella trichopoda TaxID=13333 RepID=W1NY49_AMBTC|nr:hypothetical protein AMTR_s00107p00031650 [Amborella trichopoda]